MTGPSCSTEMSGLWITRSMVLASSRAHLTGSTIVVPTGWRGTIPEPRKVIHQGEFPHTHEENVPCPDHNVVETSHRPSWGSGRPYRSSRA